MSENKTASACRVVLVGLEKELAAGLRRAIAKQARVIYLSPDSPDSESLQALQKLRADLVFCGAESRDYAALLETAQRGELPCRVVVVSRCPEVPQWLDALEAGAWDYCAPPFDVIDHLNPSFVERGSDK